MDITILGGHFLDSRSLGYSQVFLFTIQLFDARITTRYHLGRLNRKNGKNIFEGRETFNS